VVSVTISGAGGAPITRYAALLVYKQFVILKAENYACWNFDNDNWTHYFNYLSQRQIKSSTGIITQSLQPSWSEVPGYADFVQRTRNLHAQGLVEFWNAGFDCSYGTGWTEFSGAPYDYQKTHLETGQDLARTVLDFPFTAFGACYCSYDSVTTTVVNESPDIEVWLFAAETDSQKFVIPRGGGEIEISTGVPDLATFLYSYGASWPCVVLQHHPGYETFRGAFAQFEQIVDHLLNQGAHFVKPTEYARLITRGIFPLNPGQDTDGDGTADVLEGQGDGDADGLPDFLDVTQTQHNPTDPDPDPPTPDPDPEPPTLDPDPDPEPPTPDPDPDPDPEPDPDAPLGISANSVAVQTGASTILTVTPQSGLDPSWSYEWSAERGVISGTGSQVTYSASEGLTPGYDIVSVTVSGSHGPAVTRYLGIFVYKQFVILKAEDYLCWDYLSENWTYYMDYLLQKKVKTSAGLVTQCIEPSWSELPGYEGFVQFTQAMHDSGYVEFWNSGYDHSYGPDWYEFFGTGYELQKTHLDTGQRLARAVLGFPLTAFGAPFCINDATTATVVNEAPDIEVWMFPAGNGSSKTLLSRIGGEIEASGGRPSWNEFAASYGPSLPCVVLQHHPGYQAFRDNFSEFERIIDYLIEQDASFIQPTEYARLIKKKLFPLTPGDDTDGDGIQDVVEGQGDLDGNGLPDFLDQNGYEPPDPPDPDPNDTPVFDLEVDIEANSVAVRNQESLDLWLASEDELDPSWSYDWSATDGWLDAEGPTAVYFPPDSFSPGPVEVTVTIAHSDEVIATSSINLLLYKQFVMLKADDWLRDVDYYMGIGERWQQYVDYLLDKNIKTNVGLVANSLDPDYPWPGDNQWSEFVQYSLEVYDTGLVDFFNHGYDHSGEGEDDWTEFYNRPYDWQKEHLELANELAYEVLGITMVAFGAPFNGLDDTTVDVIDESSVTQLWVYGPPSVSEKPVLDRITGEIEPYSVGDPDFEGFLEGYDAEAEYAVLQHHPNFPEFEDHFGEFERIIDYLIDHETTFLTFTEYYHLIHDKVLPSD